MPQTAQLIYASQPFGYDSTTLRTILNDARRCNTQDDISGALICRHDIYVQLLEGDVDAVNAAYMRISRDDRHVGVKKLVSRPVTKRLFGEWAMLHDPAISLIWNQQQIKDGILERIPQTEIVDMFQTISTRSKIERFDH